MQIVLYKKKVKRQYTIITSNHGNNPFKMNMLSIFLFNTHPQEIIKLRLRKTVSEKIKWQIFMNLY